MTNRRFSSDQIVNKLRQAEAILSQGQSVVQACNAIGITEQTHQRRRKEYGGLKIDQAKRFKELEHVNVRLKRLFADAEFDKAILRETADPYF